MTLAVLRHFNCTFASRAAGILLLALGLAPLRVAAGHIEPGLYFDPAHNGHGFDLQQVGRRWVMVFYSYDSDSNPEWMLGVLHVDEAGSLSGSLDYFDYREDRFPRQAPVRSAGTVRLDFEVDCGNDNLRQAEFTWDLNGEEGSWCVQPLLDQESEPESDFTGLWFAGEADQGWGVSLDFTGSDSAATEVQILFYYDASGLPRWAFGSGEGGPDSVIPLRNFRGYCRLCEPVALESFDAGEVAHQLEVVDGRPQGTIDVDVAYVLGSGRWEREQSPFVPLSEPKRGLIPIPDLVDQVRELAIVNVSVIPMTQPDQVLEEQTLVIRDGQITALGDFERTAVPEDALRIDGRGLFVGPGLHDMHTHFTFGGSTAMREAGTLYIANGVTTVLNMGDGGTQNLPGTDALFGDGNFIGPAVYAGQAAYGPNDGRSATLTVTTAAGATAYAERLAATGYRFIKLYNSLSPSVVDQFFDDGPRLGLPVNGHLPKNLTMRAALEGGQDMIAHVAEIYFTLLRNQQDESLLPEAAALMLDNGVYLTDTLTASESFAANYGGNEANFLIFSRRNGIQFQPTSFAENGWRNFFESNTLNPPGSQPGQLDSRLAFFKKMVLFFQEAGVPLVLGTDSPGHIGLVSGFSVHEALRIYTEIGLTPYEAYAAGSKNPGNYFADSLGPDVSWGTVEVGKRADLLLLEANPLNTVEALQRPLGVMTRGRFYSRSHLDAALQVLDNKYPDPFTAKSKRPLRSIPFGYWCNHDT